MSRTSYAVTQLVSQVLAQRSEAEVTHGAEDGFGVYRTVTFDKDTSSWLWPLLQPLDPRFASAVLDGDGVLTLTVQSRSLLADDPTPFAGLESSRLDPGGDAGADRDAPDAEDEPGEVVDVGVPAKKAAPRKRSSAKPRQRRDGDKG